MNLDSFEVELSSLSENELDVFAEWLRRRLDLVDLERWRRQLQPRMQTTFTTEQARLTEQAQLARVAHDMVAVDGYPGELVVQVLVAEHPHHAMVIGRAVEEALAEARAT